MSQLKISQLNDKPVPEITDFVPIVDNTAIPIQTKRTTIGNILNLVSNVDYENNATPISPSTINITGALELVLSGLKHNLQIKTSGVTNSLLNTMSPNSVKVNNTNASANPTDINMNTNTVLVRSGGNIEALALTNNTVLGRDGSNNISPLNIQDVLVGVGTFNASGIATIVDARITSASIGCPTNRAGNHAAAIIHQQSVVAGSMTFQSNIANTGDFNYQIYII